MLPALANPVGTKPILAKTKTKNTTQQEHANPHVMSNPIAKDTHLQVGQHCTQAQRHDMGRQVQQLVVCHVELRQTCEPPQVRRQHPQLVARHLQADMEQLGTQI
jgi:hypothetical protein